MPPMGDLGSSIQQAWNGVLTVLGLIVNPDWNALIPLIPIGVAGALALYVVVTGGVWSIAAIRRPRPRLRYEDGPRPLRKGRDGMPEMPLGQPFSLRTGLAYPFGTVRTDDGEDLSLRCPTCGLERSAGLPTCGNCGLVLRVARRFHVASPAGPPPGGAAAA